MGAGLGDNRSGETRKLRGHGRHRARAHARNPPWHFFMPHV